MPPPTVCPVAPLFGLLTTKMFPDIVQWPLEGKKGPGLNITAVESKERLVILEKQVIAMSLVSILKDNHAKTNSEQQFSSAILENTALFECL